MEWAPPKSVSSGVQLGYVVSPKTFTVAEGDWQAHQPGEYYIKGSYVDEESGETHNVVYD